MRVIGFAGASLATGLLCLVEPSVGRAEGLKQSATSTIEVNVTTTIDGPEINTRETRAWFDVGIAAFGCDFKAVVLKNEIRTTTQPSGMEHAITVDQVTIQAQLVVEAGATPLYTVSLQGDGNDGSDVQSAEISTDSGYLSIAIGNSDIWNQRIHDLATGKFLLLSATNHSVSSIEVESDCTRERFVATSLPYDIAHDPSPRDEKLVARITYASPDGPITRALLSGTDAAWAAHGLQNSFGVPPLDARFTSIGSLEGVGRLPAVGTDAETFTNLQASVLLPNGAHIAIPLINDALDLTGATLPEGFSLMLEP